MRQPASPPANPPAFDPAAWALGIDVAIFDGPIDWKTVKKVGTTPPGSRQVARSGHGTTHHNTLTIHGVDFAFIRATDPNHPNKHKHGVDQAFQTNWQGAREAGVIRGPYHFFRPQKEVAAQVELFVTTVGALEQDDLPPVLDLEQTGGQPNEVIVERTHEWLQAVEKHYGRKPIIYVAPSFWDEHMSGQQHLKNHHRGHQHHLKALPGNSSPDTNHPAPQDVFSQYPLWIASYRSHPHLPQHPWQDWTFWQYTDRGNVRGIGSVHHPVRVDCDVFHGTVDQLKEFVKHAASGGSGPSQVSPPPHPAPDKAVPEPPPPAPEGSPEPQAAPNPPAAPSAETHTYTVHSGDTLDGIARKFGVSAADLTSINKIDNPDMIHVGQVLTIP